MKDFGVYVIITNPRSTYRVIAEACVKHEVAMLQLREKKLDDRNFLKVARELRAITRGSKTRLVINDRADIAAICDADVLHLGQDDLRMEDARKIVGDMPIGLSTHNLEQAQEALRQKPLYIGFGPIYPTPAKEKPDPAVGPDLLQEVLKLANIPVVAIGGLFPENIDNVLRAGAKNFAMVRYLMESTNFEQRLIQLKSLTEQTCQHK